jgi:NAD(P)-dependent dehydrogenase (short-subunit alcohol dehydrogenase family)
VNRIIVITGAGEGLGRALAKRLAADGETIVLLGRTLSKLEAVVAEIAAENPGHGGHLALSCDVGEPDSVRAAFAAIAARFPRIDVMINNAAIYEPFTLGEAPDDKIMAQVKTNLLGPIYCSREALPLLRGTDGKAGGHLINVSSETVQLRMPMLWLYGGVKAAMEHMSLDWSLALKPDGVRVSVVRAGMMMDETKTGSNWPPENAIRFVQENAKVGRDLREQPISHYNSAAKTIHAVINASPDINLDFVALSAVKP